MISGLPLQTTKNDRLRHYRIHYVFEEAPC